MKRYFIIFCMLAITAAGASAQDTTAVAQAPDSYRTNSWSVYGQGGMSWVGGVGMDNVNARPGTNVSGMVGLGVDYNFFPWVRLGLNYEFSKYAREQHFGEFQPLDKPQLDFGDGYLKEMNGGLAYRDIWTHYHAVDLTAEFNVMEIWKDRKCKWFNLYGGVGAGVMFGNGNVYGIAMGNELWNDGKNTHVHSWVKADNVRHNFAAFYIPVTLSAEFDVMPVLTFGVKFGYKFAFSGHEMAPGNVGTLALTARYNILGEKHGYKSNRQKYAGAVEDYKALKSDYDRMRKDCADRQAAAAGVAEDHQARIDALEAENARLRPFEAENDALKAENERMRHAYEALTAEFSLQFRFNSSSLTERQLGRLQRYIETIDPEARFIIVGEATNEGDEAYNQLLSERRAESIVKLLHDAGVGNERIESSTGIGSSRKLLDSAARRVTIKIVK